jgi:hypothetical protein
MDDLTRERLQQIAAISTRDRILIAFGLGDMSSLERNPDKVTALADAAEALQQADIAYALIGGVAVGVHSGIPRATLDVDLAVVSTSDRSRIVSTLRQAGFHLVGEFEHSANFRHRSGEPVQLAFDASFDAMIDRAETLKLGDLAIRIVRKDDLIEMKRRAAADPKRRRSKALRDQADIELLRGDVPDPDEGW